MRRMDAIAGRVAGSMGTRRREGGVVVPFVVTVQGKIKQNLVAAESEEEAVEIFDESYPRFVGARKAVVRVVRSGLLF